MNEIEKINFDTNELNVILLSLDIGMKYFEKEQENPIFKELNEIYGSERKDIIKVMQKINNYWETKQKQS